jgi:hypothetical protein
MFSSVPFSLLAVLRVIEDGQQAMSNDCHEKRPQKQVLPFLGWCFAKAGTAV